MDNSAKTVAQMSPADFEEMMVRVLARAAHLNATLFEFERRRNWNLEPEPLESAELEEKRVQRKTVLGIDPD